MLRNMFRRCLLCQSSKHSMRDCKKPVFRKGSCCVSCGFPQKAFHEVIHGNVETGECEQGLGDAMKGAVWRIWRDEELREKYLKEYESEVETEDKFREWITRLDETGEFINGCRLMLIVYKDLYC